MLATKVGSRATGSVWSAKTGVKPATKNANGARRAYPVGLRRQVVRTIEKITGTMKLVAQAQLLGTTKKAKETSTFFLNVQQMMQKFPLPNVEEGKQKTMTAVISSNRGLCGSLNSQLVRDVIRMPETQDDAQLFVFGDKGATALEKRVGVNVRVVASAHPGKTANFLDFSRAGELLSEEEYDRVMFVFNKMISNHAFEVTKMFLPSYKTMLKTPTTDVPFDYEESDEELFQNFHEFALAAAFHYTYYQSAAAETLSRRNAMDGANKNCKELKLKLSIVFNKLRQALITTDLIEITTGSTAVEEMG